MFKKLKDKLEEEFKSSPLRLSASVQQIAQVISPSPSVNSLSDTKTSEGAAAPLPDPLAVPADFFSICDDQEVDEGNKRLHMVDLTANSPSIMTARSRRDSISSMASDVSSLFPIYESPLNHSTLQSEWESEIDDSTTSQLDKVSKEHLYQGYKKLLYRYNKYKGRFMDLSRIHKDLQYEHIKTKNVLQESQDKALRRMAELREQCNLEQEAKAHLEESLRNDLEERDHIIATLKTKIGLLKTTPSDADPDLNVTISDSDTTNEPLENDEDIRAKNVELAAEVARLKKLVDASPLLPNGPTIESASAEQVKEKITQLKSGIVRMKSENENLSNLLSKSPSASDAGDDSASLIDFSSPETDEKDKRIEKLSTILLKCKEKINSLNLELRDKNASVLELNEKVIQLTKDADVAKDSVEKLTQEINELKVREEESVLTVAENKMAIHSELEAKEKQIRQLTQDLEDSRAVEKEIKAKAESRLAHYEAEMLKLKDAVMKATQVKNDALEKLKKGENVKPKEVNPVVIDFAALEKEKQRLDANLQMFLQRHQDKLNDVFSMLEAKVTKAEGNLVRMCADKLIASRTSELELRQNITALETQANNFGIEAFKIEDLEKQIKTLEAAIGEKDKIIEGNMKNVESLNLELSEKIDRIVALGAELEEAGDKHKLVLESLESSNQNLAKLKTDSDKKYAELQEEVNKLQSQINSLSLENSKLKTNNEELEKANKEYQNTHTKLEISLEEKQGAVEQLNQEMSRIQAELVEKDEKFRKSSEEIVELKKKIECTEDSAIKLNQSCDELKTVENEVVKLRSALRNVEEERNHGLAEKEKLEQELRNQAEIVKSKEELAENRLKEINESKNVITRYDDQILTMKKQLELKSEEIEKVTSVLAIKDKEKDEALVSLEKKLETETSQLRAKLHNVERNLEESEKERNNMSESKLKEASNLSEEIVELKQRLSSVLLENNEKTESLTCANSILKEHEAEVEQLRQQCEQLQSELEEKTKAVETLIGEELSMKRSYEEIEDKLKREVEEKEREIERLHGVTDEVKNKFDLANEQASEEYRKLQAVIEDHKTKERSLVDEINTAKNELLQLQTRLQEDTAKLKGDSDLKVNILKNEIKFLNDKFEGEVGNLEKNREREAEELREKLDHSERTAAELLNKLEAASAERDELSQLCSEKSLKVSELEGCLADLKADLDRNFNQTSKISNTEFEEIYESKLKKIVNDYEVEISKQHERIREMEVELSEKSEALESLESLRSELKNLRKELKAKDDALETKIEELEELKKESENKIINSKIDSDDLLEEERKKFERVLKTQKEEFELRLISEQEKFTHLLEEEKSDKVHSIDEERRKYEEKVRCLEENMEKSKQEWVIQKKSNEGLESAPSCEDVVAVNSPVDLECTSKIAVAAVGSSTGSIDMLRREIMKQADEIKELKKQHKREVIELGKLAALRSRRVSEREREGEDVEHEYLRNILYEYMMGREQMVLAKVLAAIVKFDHQQIHNILERQAAAGSLRIL